MYAEAEATDETTSPNKEYNAELTKYTRIIYSFQVTTRRVRSCMPNT